MSIKKYTLALLPTIALVACGGEEQTLNTPVQPGSVVYSFPADGQTEVSPSADLVLRFSHAIIDENLEDHIRLASDDGEVAFTARKVDGGRSLVLSPASALSVGTTYTVDFNGHLTAADNRQVPTPNATGPEGIQFTTRGGLAGVAELDNLDGEFTIAEATPSSDSLFTPMDFSTFRLRATQPIHPDSVIYGTTVSLWDSAGELVPATVVAKGRLLSLDPCTTEDPAECGSTEDRLQAGQTYTLAIAGLTNLQGDTLNHEMTFTPQDTGPTEILYQEIIDSGFSEQSILNGQFVNAVTLNSVLQGTAGPSQQSGALYAELAYAPNFPGDTPVPLRIPRGTVLKSTSLDVLINGQVPVIDPATETTQQTGTINVTMISDASGYLYPNPYSDSSEAPRHIKLFMDVAMNTENAQPNASLSQNLLRVELSGIAFVRNNLLTIDAIGMVEPNLLGQEVTNSTIAFRLEADTAIQNSVPDRAPDVTAPELVSWMPGPEDARQAMQRPGDPLVLNFNEPLDPDSIADGFILNADGVEMPADQLRTRLDGTAVVLNPVDGLEHGVDYTLNITNSLTDLAGNGVASQALSFALPAITDNTDPDVVSPLALTTYPGYPCVTQGLNLSQGSHGQCVDASPDGPSGDQLPITKMPSDRPIVVVFSQSMDLGSIRPGETFIVEKVDAGGAVTGTVSGRIEKNNQRIRFYPDQPWTPGNLYRYTLASSSSQGSCASAICSSEGYPLQTDLLVNPEDIGGPDLTIYFEGAASRRSVFTPLRNLPIRDTNSNYIVDCNEPGGTDCLEPFDHEPDGAGGFLPSANAAKLLVDKEATALGVSVGASVGCPADENCQRNKFIYQTYALNTEVIGPAVDEATGKTGVRVLLYPTVLATTSASVFLDGFGEQATGPQILRMRYGQPSEGNPEGLVEGIIVEGDNGAPVFKTTANLMLDAPNLELPLASALEHNLYSKAFTLDLAGDITFFDDGRMQIEQRNNNQPPINVSVNVTVPIVEEFLSYSQCVQERGTISGVFSCLLDSSTESDSGDINIPLIIPEQGVYLNFISNPIKEIPDEG